MIITHSTKIFMRTSGLVWRILPYMLVCLLIVLGIAFAACYPLITELSNAGFFSQIASLLGDNFMNVNIADLFNSISDLMVSFGDIVAQNIGLLVPLVVILLLILGLGGSFLIGLSELAIADYLYAYMSSNSRLSFGSCFVRNLKKSAKLQLAKLLVVWPVDLFITACFVGSILLFTIDNAVVTFIAPFVIVLVLTLLISLRQTMFCMWAPCLVVHNGTVFGALRESFRQMGKNFGAIFPRQLVMTIIYIGVNIAVCLFTASVGLLLTIPATVLFAVILGQVAFFHINGLKFYIDENQIISPHKKEEWEQPSALKDII